MTMPIDSKWIAWELIRSARMPVSQVTYSARINRNEITFRFQCRYCDCEMDRSLPLTGNANLQTSRSIALSPSSVSPSCKSGELNEVLREASLSLPRTIFHLEKPSSALCKEKLRHVWPNLHWFEYAAPCFFSLCRFTWANRRNESRPDHLE